MSDLRGRGEYHVLGLWRRGMRRVRVDRSSDVSELLGERLGDVSELLGVGPAVVSDVQRVRPSELSGVLRLRRRDVRDVRRVGDCSRDVRGLRRLGLGLVRRLRGGRPCHRNLSDMQRVRRGELFAMRRVR